MAGLSFAFNGSVKGAIPLNTPLAHSVAIIGAQFNAMPHIGDDPSTKMYPTPFPGKSG